MTDTNKVQEDNIRINGKSWHLMKLMEESIELSDAIIKYFTKGGDEIDILKEAGDVEIALSNIRVIYKSESLTIDVSKESKNKKIEDKTNELLHSGGSLGDMMLRRFLDGRGGIEKEL